MPRATAASSRPSATAAASTLPFCTAMALASWLPAKMARRSASGLSPARIIAVLGNRWPEVELGSTKAKVWPLRSASERMLRSLRAMISEW